MVVRFSDFKTNESQHFSEVKILNLKKIRCWAGGAHRVITTPKFKEAFKLECRAMKKSEGTIWPQNIVALIPFARTPEEGQKVLDIMKEEGLERGGDGPLAPPYQASATSFGSGFKVYVICEIPANVLRADEFLDIFDGFSIGSNDLKPAYFRP